MGPHGKMAALGAILAFLGFALDVQAALHDTSVPAPEKSKQYLAEPKTKADDGVMPMLQSLLYVLSGGDDVMARRDVYDTDDEVKGQKRHKRIIETSPNLRWTYGIVPYAFNFNDSNAVRTIKVVMELVEYFTCMRFVPYEPGVTRQKYGLDHDGWLKFISSSGCFAAQGNQRMSDGQNVACCGGETCIHEFGHAMGLPHEHMNEFRDDYVRANFTAMQDGIRGFYSKSAPGQFTAADIYDLSSTMHYQPCFFSKPGMRTLKMFDENLRFGAGHHYYFKNVVEGHNCKGMNCSSFNITCENDGFVSLINGTCMCYCPFGLDPDTGCTTVITKEKNTATGWPKGKWGLLQPRDGCPGKPGDFKTGERLEHMEGGNGGGTFNPLVGLSWFHVTLHFCLKDPPVSNNINWPRGRYCIYRYGGSCPEGFVSSYAVFEDTIPAGQSNSVSGTLPDGVFDNNTRYEYCCRGNTFDSIPVNLPTDKNFILYRMDYWQNCPNVPGMGAENGFHTFNSAENDKNLKPGFYGDITPQQITTGGKYSYVYFCYYQPKFTECGGFYNLNDSNPVVFFTTPNYPKVYNSLSSCYYFFKGPVDSTLVMTFLDFEMPNNCDDGLRIRFNNPGAEHIGYCGSGGMPQGSFQSGRNYLFLNFFSNTLDNRRGFKGRVRMIRDSELCYNRTDKGASYRGTKNYARNYKSCVPWSEVSHCRMSLFESGNGEYGLEENYCRNPGFGLRPWCFVVAESCERVYCDVCDLDDPYDTEKDCKNLKKSGMCAQNSSLALAFCALTCNSDLPSENAAPPVYMLSCGTPPSVPFASILEAPKTSYTVGEKVTYKCQDGNETMSSSCLTTGDWSPVKYVCGGCNDGWFYSDGFCYGHFYTALNSWDAKAYCGNFNGGIISPVKTDKELAVVKNLRDLREEFRNILIGLNDTKTEGDYYWTDGTPAIKPPWGPGEPNNYYNEDCAMLTGLGLIGDVNCGTRSSFICRAPLRTSNTTSNSSTLLCVDRRADCRSLFAKYPTFCKDHEGFAMLSCRHTCGFCSGGQGCSAPTISASSKVKMVTGETKVPTGGLFRMECMPGTMLTSGNLVRGCLSDGTLVGTAPVCSDSSKLTTKLNSLEMYSRDQIGESKILYVGNSSYLTITRPGVLTKWMFYSKDARKMMLQVWRPSSKGPYTRVGFTYVKTKGNKINIIDLSSADAIQVMPGDVVGLWYDSSKSGGVTYDGCEAAKRPDGNPVYKITIEDSAINATNSVTIPTTSQCVVFSLTAIISPS